MKRYFAMALSIAAISACNKAGVSDNRENPGSEYVLYAEDVHTKTVTDASFNVIWSDNDDLAVYTWPEGEALPETKVWQNSNPVKFVTGSGHSTPRPFLLSESGSKSDPLEAFKTRFRASGSTLNWGVIYPGSMNYPSTPGRGLVSFGDGAGVVSHQEGNGNMDHLARQDVLWGKASGKSPVVQMKHLGTMMAYTVKNSSGEPFTVYSITITVKGANIGGNFRVNVFDGTFDSCMTSYHDCTLWIDNGTQLEIGESAQFYQVVAPFVLQNGNLITMTVNTSKGTWTKTNTLSSQKSFESGKKNVMTLPIDLDIWFAPDSNSGGYFNLENGARSTWSSVGGTFNQADIDMIVFRGNGGNEGGKLTYLTFAAPTDEDVWKYVDTTVESWMPKNATKFKKISAAYADVTSLDEAKAAYEAGVGVGPDGAEAGRVYLAAGETAIAHTVDGYYAVINVIRGNKDSDQVWQSFRIQTKSFKDETSNNQ